MSKSRARDVLAEMPCLVTERNECDALAEPMASMAIWREPSVPFLNPTVEEMLENMRRVSA